MNAILLPHKYKPIGWILLATATIIGIIISTTGYEAGWLQAHTFTLFDLDLFGKGRWFQWVETNLTNTLTGVTFIAGAMIVTLSKEKTEDEFIGKLRLSALLWAVCINYALLLLALLLVQGFSFLIVMVYNMFTVLILFIIRFNYLMYKHKKMLPDEEYN